VKKVFIDTSIFIRFFTKDIETKYQECEDFFRLIESGSIKPYTSNIVLMEIIFVLTRQYKFSGTKVGKALEKLLDIRNLTLIEKSDTPKALRLFEKYKIKYADCLISTQIPQKTILITYDSDFLKIKSLKTATPKEIISN